MKNSFTLLEIVFVILVIGILAKLLLTKNPSDHLDRAVHQIISHIRYTQHLALKQDFYSTTDPHWFKRRWRISFNRGEGTNSYWAYTVWADTAAAASGSPDPQEIALNPQNPAKKLTGGFNGNQFIHAGDPEATEELTIGAYYGIKDVKFSSACRTGTHSKSIGFDHIGRPLRGAIENYTSPYDSAVATNVLIVAQCTITLCTVDNCSTATDEQKRTIAIEAETGYAHILN
ncbi:MAG: Tfp pilus assembly protein FimT/FimU [Sulfuricurvum sp.]